MNLKAIRVNNTRAFNKFPHVVEALYNLGVIHRGQIQNKNGEWKTYRSRMCYLKEVHNEVHNEKGELNRLINGMADGNQIIRPQPLLDLPKKRIKIDVALAMDLTEFIALLKRAEVSFRAVSKETEARFAQEKPSW